MYVVSPFHRTVKLCRLERHPMFSKHKFEDEIPVTIPTHSVARLIANTRLLVPICWMKGNVFPHKQVPLFDLTAQSRTSQKKQGN